MKSGIIALIFTLIVLMPFSYAKTETVILDREESFVIDGINVTLLDYQKKKEKLLVCVDNQRAILSDDKRVSQVYFEIVSFRDDGVKIHLEADCDDCIADDNSRCFPEKNFTEIENYFENEISNETDSDENETDEIGIEGEQEDKDRYSGILKRIIIFISNL
ncbi:MAG: hypothetical protein AABX49_01765, partial [Nanoarchaeota archaeon]